MLANILITKLRNLRRKPVLLKRNCPLESDYRFWMQILTFQ
jgi:hypothetical protein